METLGVDLGESDHVCMYVCMHTCMYSHKQMYGTYIHVYIHTHKRRTYTHISK